VNNRSKSKHAKRTWVQTRNFKPRHITLEPKVWDRLKQLKEHYALSSISAMITELVIRHETGGKS